MRATLCEVSLLLLFALAGVAAGQSPAPLAARQATNDLERSLESFVTNLYGKVASDDEAVRRETYTRVLAGKADMAALFGANAELVWPRLGPKIEKVIASAPRMAGRTRRRGAIDNIISAIELADLRADERFAAFIALIPADVPAYRVVTHREKGAISAQSGPYLFVSGRWLWMPEVDQMPRVLRYLKERGKQEKDADPSDAPAASQDL